jgi:hypothetical protein
MPEHPAITWVPFHPAHISVMKIHPDQIESVAKGPSLEKIITAQAQLGHAITGILHGRPFVCMGAVDLWDGVVEMWLLIEERGRKYGKTLTRAAIGYRDFMVISKNLHRLQITVRCDDSRAFKWAKAIGFETEATMKAYGPTGSDYYLMRRI